MTNKEIREYLYYTDFIENYDMVNNIWHVEMKNETIPNNNVIYTKAEMIEKIEEWKWMNLN